jgi:hypothetical protein
VAARDLGIGRLPQPGDLTIDKTPLRYVIKQIAKDQSVSSDTVASQPPLPLRVLALTLPVSGGQVRDGSVNANTALRLCKGAAELGRNLRVLTVLCAARQSDECIALVAVPVDNAKAIADVLGPEVKRVTSDKCG